MGRDTSFQLIRAGNFNLANRSRWVCPRSLRSVNSLYIGVNPRSLTAYHTNPSAKACLDYLAEADLLTEENADALLNPLHSDLLQADERDQILWTLIAKDKMTQVVFDRLLFHARKTNAREATHLFAGCMLLLQDSGILTAANVELLCDPAHEALFSRVFLGVLAATALHKITQVAFDELLLAAKSPYPLVSVACFLQRLHGQATPDERFRGHVESYIYRGVMTYLSLRSSTSTVPFALQFTDEMLALARGDQAEITKALEAPLLPLVQREFGARSTSVKLPDFLHAVLMSFAIKPADDMTLRHNFAASRGYHQYCKMLVGSQGLFSADTGWLTAHNPSALLMDGALDDRSNLTKDCEATLSAGRY